MSLSITIGLRESLWHAVVQRLPGCIAGRGPLIGAIAVLGATNTAYLTATRLTGNEAACPTEGCSKVLGSPYAEVFGQPLALFGLIAYIAMAIFCVSPFGPWF